MRIRMKIGGVVGRCVMRKLTVCLQTGSACLEHSLSMQFALSLNRPGYKMINLLCELEERNGTLLVGEWR